MMALARIDRLERENDELRHDVVQAMTNHGADLNKHASAIERVPGGRRLVYNKATRKIDVVTTDGLVTDSFDPPQERL